MQVFGRHQRGTYVAVKAEQGCRAARKGRNARALRSILLTYGIYNANLGYVQVRGGSCMRE